MEALSSLSTGSASLVLLAIFVLLLVSGIWVAVAVAITAIAAFVFFTPFNPANIIKLGTWNASTTYVLTSLPMFILVGNLVLKTKLSRWLFDGLAPWTAWLPGRLLHVNVAACTLFAGVSGSSAATAATVGSIAYDELNRRGYDKLLSIGSLAGAGTLGILIPPSLVPIVYVSIVGGSIGSIFMAGVLPGLMVASLFSLWIVARALLQPSVVPSHAERFTWKQRWVGLLRISPVLALMAVMLGTIYTGFATPTESAALGVAAVLAIGLATRTLTWKGFLEGTAGACRTTSMIMVIIVTAAFLSSAMAYLRIPTMVTQSLVAMTGNPDVTLLLLCGAYVVLGMFLEATSIMVLTLPVVIPVIDAFGIDRVWFAIFLVIMIEMAAVTPPVGLNLFVLRNLSGHSITDIALGALPFMALLLISVILIRVWPEIVLWLPRTMG